MPMACESWRDALWMDLLWSDPQEDYGVCPSSRGAGVEFGPDITRRFLLDNPRIKLVVRSHALPDEGGFQRHHLGKLVTVFSASNYCGDCGNRGAVLIFETATLPSYSAYEYYAPPLELIHGLAAQGKDAKEWLAL